MKVRGEVQIGVIGIVTLVVLFFGIKFLKGSSIFSSYNNYYAYYDDVSGMHESSYIYAGGMKVGYVKNIRPMNKLNTKFLVGISIKNEIFIPKDSRLTIFSDGLLGTKAIRIDMGHSNIGAKENDTIMGVIETGKMRSVTDDIPTITGNLSSTVKRIDTLTASLNAVLDLQGRNNLKSTIANLNSITNNLNSLVASADDLVKRDKQKLDGIVSNVLSITQNIKDNNAELNSIIDNFSSIADTIARANVGNTIKNFNESLTSLNLILSKIERGKGNIGQLISNEDLYNNITTAAKNLNDLILDIKTNPKRYISVSVF